MSTALTVTKLKSTKDWVNHIEMLRGLPDETLEYVIQHSGSTKEPEIYKGTVCAEEQFCHGDLSHFAASWAATFLDSRKRRKCLLEALIIEV